MKKLSLIACSLLFAAFALPGMVEAQGDTWKPGGSYLKTCKYIEVKGSMIFATCQKRDGSWVDTWITIDLENQNGRLVAVPLYG